MFRPFAMAGGGALLLLLATGCREAVPPGALVVAQQPVAAIPDQTTLAAAGGRVVLTWSPFQPAQTRLLSQGVLDASQPVLSPDARRVLFSGRPKTGAPSQIYESALEAPLPQALTRCPAGAGSPAWLGNGDFIFVSPPAGTPAAITNPPALYAQTGRGTPRRLTFSGTAATDPTVLPDGRICFVGYRPEALNRPGLFVINNDGTEISAFALVHAGLSTVLRPRVWPDGRVAFLTEKFAGSVALARPFHPYETLLPDCSALEWETAATRLACQPGANPQRQAVYRWHADRNQAPECLLDDPAWSSRVALAAAPSIRPMGHLSNVVPGLATGTLLCLASQWSDRTSASNAPAARVRVFSGGKSETVLGEAPVERDGSFLLEVPADQPLGFETLNAAGQVLDRCPPMVWVRPGENRSCLGCHEPHNRSPRNRRVEAVQHPPHRLTTRPIAARQP